MSNSKQDPKSHPPQGGSSTIPLVLGVIVLAAVGNFAFKSTEKAPPSEASRATTMGQDKTSPTGKAKSPLPNTSQIPNFPRDAKNRALKERLQKARIDISMRAVPLESALTKIFQPLKVNLFYSQSAREMMAEEDLQLTLQLKNVSAYSALKHIDAEFPNLPLRMLEGVIHVGSSESYQPVMKLGFYDVSTLVKSFESARAMEEKAEREAAAKNPPVKDETEDESDDSSACLGIEPILEVFETTLGERDEDHAISLHGTMLQVRASQQEHKMIQQVIEAFNKNVHSSNALLLHNFNGQAATHEANKAWGQKAGKQLEKPMPPVNFDNIPFLEFVDFIREKTQLNITVAQDLDFDSMAVTMQLKDKTYKAALDWVLKDHRLAIIPFHEAFRIVAIDNGEHRYFQLKIYSVEDIIYPNGKVNPDLEDERLAELIRRATDEELWQDPASIHFYGGQMFIYQTDEFFVDAEKVLKKLRADMKRKK